MLSVNKYKISTEEILNHFTIKVNLNLKKGFFSSFCDKTINIFILSREKKHNQYLSFNMNR